MKTLLLVISLLLASCSSEEKIGKVKTNKKKTAEAGIETSPVVTTTFPQGTQVEIPPQTQQTEQVDTTQAIPLESEFVANSTDVYTLTPVQRAEIHSKCIQGLHDGSGAAVTHARVIELNSDRVETNSNLACLVRTNLTPSKVKVKMRANMYKYVETDNFQEFIDFHIDESKLCGEKVDANAEYVKAIQAIEANGCEALYDSRVDDKGNIISISNLRAQCFDQYGYQQCNAFRKTFKTCKDTENDDTITLKFKMDKLDMHQYEVYRVYTRQGTGFLGSRKRIDFNLEAIETIHPVKYKSEKNRRIFNIGEDSRTIKYVDDSCEDCD